MSAKVKLRSAASILIRRHRWIPATSTVACAAIVLIVVAEGVSTPWVLGACTALLLASYAWGYTARAFMVINYPSLLHLPRRRYSEVWDALAASPSLARFAYLQAKKEKMGHALSQNGLELKGAVRHSRFDEPDRRNKGRRPVRREQSPFTRIEVALRELRAGRIIVVVDDEERENEGDLVMAAEMITPDDVNFMATHGRGLICLAMTGTRLDELQLSPMAPDNTALCGTGFAVSIDARGRGVSTGISASDRAQTIRAALDARSGPEDFARPGHVFPLRARPGGVLERRGHTEAAVDLARLAHLHPSGVICEILNSDGTMARVPDLVKFCRINELKMITVEALTRYRLSGDSEGSVWSDNGVFGDHRAAAGVRGND